MCVALRSHVRPLTHTPLSQTNTTQVRTLNEIPVKTRREGVLKGGYIAKKEKTALTHIIISAGSEMQWAMDAAAELGDRYV